MDTKNNNEWLYLGLFFLFVGFMLAVYSVSSYMELKSFAQKVEFDLIDGNNNLTSAQKYYKYLDIFDFVMQKLDKNKSLPVKNTSCVYLDYAQHSVIEMDYVLQERLEVDYEKQKQASDAVDALAEMLNYYRTCPKTQLYKDELIKISKKQ